MSVLRYYTNKLFGMSLKPIILCDVAEYGPRIRKELLKIQPDLQIFDVDYETGAVSKEAANCEILLARPVIVPSLVRKLPKLKWIQSTWVGADGVKELKNMYDNAPPFAYTRSEVGQGQLMAEYVFGHIIAWERRFRYFDQLERQKIWNRECIYRSLDQLTIGVMGVGEIGTKIAKVAKCFGMQVYGLVRLESSIGKSSDIDHYCTFDSIDKLLGNCDHIVNTLPSTDQTAGLLSLDLLKRCRKAPVFINVGRGNVIPEQDLVTALQEGIISGAILDVFEVEPLPKSSPLWEMENVTITPHTSAETFPDKVAECFVNNYRNYCSGEKLQYLIDWDAGY